MFTPKRSEVNLCTGGNFTLTCVTDTDTLVWRVGHLTKTFSNALPENQPNSFSDHIIEYLTSVSTSNITTVANITKAPLALSGTMIQCRNSDSDSKEKLLIVSGKKTI